MLNLTTALGRNGLQDWILQRVTALIMALYILGLLSFWLYMPLCKTLSWQWLFSIQAIRFVTVLALISLIIHAWIGMWTVITDYIKTSYLAFFTKVFVFLALVFDFFWGMQILWG